MSDINENFNSEHPSSGANGPMSSAKLKEYGKKAYGPFVNVMYKYQDEFTPYLKAISKGLQGGVDSLSQTSASEPEKYVGQFFKEAADGFRLACDKIESKDVHALTTFLSEQAEKRPGVMFSTSYIAGLFFGRLGRHLTAKKESWSSTTLNTTPSMDESIH